MKTRRTTLVAFLLCAIMLLGVGFAAVVDDLSINGSITTNNSATQVAFKEKIYFSKAEVADDAAKTAGDEAHILSNENKGDDKDVVDLLVKSLKLRGDKTTFNLEITNEAQEYDALITLGTPSLEGDSTFFSVKYLLSGQEIGAEGFTVSTTPVTIQVVVELLASPDVTINGTFGIALTATSVAREPNN